MNSKYLGIATVIEVDRKLYRICVQLDEPKHETSTQSVWLIPSTQSVWLIPNQIKGGLQKHIKEGSKGNLYYCASSSCGLHHFDPIDE
jgi:hypothetical protein